MAQIHTFGLANSLLDSPMMAAWLTLTGTLIYFPVLCVARPFNNYLEAGLKKDLVQRHGVKSQC